MATKETFQADVAVALKAPDAANLDKLIKSILETVDKLPSSVKGANSAVAEMLGQIKKISDALGKGVSLNGITNDVKTLSASLKSLQTLGKATELFSNKDIENINKATATMQAAAKAYEAIQRNQAISKGVFGLDETTIKGVTAATKILQTELSAVKQTIATLGLDKRKTVSEPIVARGATIARNIAALDSRGTTITEAAAQLKAQRAWHDDQLRETVRFQKERERLQKATDKQNDPDAARAAEARRAGGMMARVTGQGGAALLAVQASLIANYSILTTAIQGIRSAITTSVELEAAFRNVQAVTATTGTEMTVLEERIKSVAASSKFSAIEVAGAALILGQAGLSAKQTGEAIPAVVALATAAGTSLAQAVDLVTSVVGVFDKRVTDTADIANKITQAANASKVSVEKLALGLQYAGNIAAQSGISFEETTAAMATMSNAGIKSGSTMGTGLRQFLIEVQKPSKEFLSTLHQLGLSISDLDFRSKGLVGVVSTLQHAGFVASDAIKSFDVRGAAAFNAMLADPAALDRQYQGLLNTNAAVAANEVQMDSLKSQAARLTTSLGNLTSTGLEPLSSVLKGTAGGLATLIQSLTGAPGIVQALTTATAAFIGVGLVRHFLDIAQGGLALMKVQGGLATVVGALTTMTVGQAAASVTATATTGALAVAQVGATATTLTLSGAVRALWASFTGLSIISGIGIALAVASGAFMVFNSIAGKTAEEMDKLKAKTNDAKAAVEEKEGVVKSLTQKIEDLRYKEVALRGDTKLLETAIKEANAQFGATGFQMDTNNPKYDTLISKLRSVRAEMMGIARTKLDLMVNADKDLLGAQTKERTNTGKYLRGETFGSMGVSTLNKLESFLKKIDTSALSGSERDSISRDMAVLKNPNSSATALAGTSNMLGIIGKSKMEDQARKFFEELSQDIAPYIAQAQKEAIQASTVAGGELAQSSSDANKRFRDSKLFGGKTFEDAVPIAVNEEIQVRRDNPQADRLAVYAKTRAVRLAKIAEIEKVITQLEDPNFTKGIPAEVADKAKTEAKGELEKIRSMGIKAWGEIKTQAETEMLGRVGERTARMGGRANRSVLGTGNSKAELQLENGRDRASFAEMGLYGSDDLSQARSEAALVKARAAADTTLGNADRSAGDRRISEEITALKKAAEDASTQARGSKSRASQVSSFEEMDKHMEEGVQHLLDAKGLKLQALLIEQGKRVNKGDRNAKTQATMDAEVQDVTDEADAQIRTYMDGFVDIVTKVGKRIDKQTRKLDVVKAEAELKEIKDAGEEKVYTAGSPARKLAREVASGRMYAEDSDLKKALLAETQMKAQVLTETLGYLGDDSVGYISKLAELASKARAELARLEGALANTPELTTSEREALGARIGYQQGVVKSSSEDLHRNRGLARSTQNSLDSTNNSIEQQNRAIPQEASWKSLTDRMEEAWSKYRAFVRDMDVNKTVGDGMFSALQSSTGAMSTFFTTLATQSMSAGQAFRNMASSMIRSMMDVLSQALAMQAVKSILGMFSGSFSGGATTSAVSGWETGTQAMTVTDLGLLPKAEGGPITGGTPGKDSVGVLAMPGEFMVKKTAVDVVGQDFLNGLNKTTNSTVSSSSSSSPFSGKGGGDTTNIWIVPPATKPTMGPKDVVIAVTDDMMRGGTTRQLIKQIQAGG